MSRDLESAVAPVAVALESLGIDYYVAGSVISSLFGIARATADVDVVAAMRREHAGPFSSMLVDTYYCDEDMIIDAITRHSMFNVIHLAMLNVDIYIASSPFDRSALDPLNRALEQVGP